MRRPTEYTKRPMDVNIKQMPADLYNALTGIASVERRTLTGQILIALQAFVEQQSEAKRQERR